MIDDIPNCPYCNKNVFVRKKIKGRIWEKVTFNTKTVYHYYVGCKTCFMRGPLMTSEDDAIDAYETLTRRVR